MDIPYYNYNYNRNYYRRQSDYNENEYSIYGQYSDNINISTYNDDLYNNNVKNEKKLSLSNIFSFYFKENKNKGSYDYYKKGNKFIVKGFTKNDKIYLIGLSLISLGLNILNFCKSYEGAENIKKNLYLDNQPYFIKKFLSFGIKNDNEFIDITNPFTVPLLQSVQVIINNICICLTYLSIKNFGNSDLSSLIGGSLVLFNSIFNMNSILNASYSPYTLILFIGIYFWSKLSYTPEDYKYVLGSSICSGLSLCLNWNGILTYFTGIVISIKNGLDIKGNNKLSNSEISRKMAGSFLTALGLPLVIFLCISSVIPSDHNLNNDYLYLKDKSNIEATFNSDVLIRNYAYGGYISYNGVLDINYNNTEIYNSLTVKPSSLWTVIRSDSKSNTEKLKHMSYVRLRNNENRKFIRINTNKDDKFKKRNKASSYNVSTGGYLKILDSKEYWKVEIVGIFKSNGIKIGKTKFRLHNIKANCYLTSEPHSIFINDGVTEPRITCKKGQSEGSTWVFAYANLNEEDEKFKKESFTLETKGVISSFMYKWKMSTGEYGNYEQTFRPFFWPTLNKLTMMFTNKSEVSHFKLNTFSWNIAFAGIVAFPIILFRKIIRDKNTACFDIDTIEKYSAKNIYNTGAIISFIGWICHYIPYLVLRRMALIENYIPAFYFSILLATSCIEIYLSETHSKSRKITITSAIIGLSLLFNLINI